LLKDKQIQLNDYHMLPTFEQNKGSFKSKFILSKV